MTKYLVETISMFRLRYVVEAECADHAKDKVVMNTGDYDFAEFSQFHLGETISSTREIDDTEYLHLFDEDNEYLKEWPTERKFNAVNKVDYNK